MSQSEWLGAILIAGFIVCLAMQKPAVGLLVVVARRRRGAVAVHPT